jgi:hypothetical protein
VANRPMTLLRQGCLWLALFLTLGALVMVWLTYPWWVSTPASFLFAVFAAYCALCLTFDPQRYRNAR